MIDASAIFRDEIARLIEKIMEREFLMELLMRDVSDAARLFPNDRALVINA